jgi:nucleoside-diphosphate-sugar epimerase
MTVQRVLITGAAGAIGRATTRHFAAAGVDVTGLVLEDPGDLEADRVVVGDARDRVAVEEALGGVDAVVHLAAIPAPSLGTADQVFHGNTAATFTVLDAAGERGITRAAIASSINALGYAYSPSIDVHPDYLPLDEDLPTQAADPYALSKFIDEATAAAMVRRHGMSIVALRFPLVGGGADIGGRLPYWAEKLTAHPAGGARDLWLHLDSRDAARAIELALSPAEPGAHVVFVAAPVTIVPYHTEDLLELFHPDVPRRRAFPGRTAPVDLSRAEKLLGFSANHVHHTELRELPHEMRKR